MPFSIAWSELLREAEDIPAGSTLLTALSHDRFRITDVQQPRIIIEFEDTVNSVPLKRDQFETLYHHIEDAQHGFELDRLPPDADPYPAVLSLHPRFEIDEDPGLIRKTDAPTPPTQLLETDSDDADSHRTEPDIPVYSDALLLIDALERHGTELDDLTTLDTSALVNLYTLLSDLQQDADDLRQDLSDILLDRLHHDRPVSGQYGSVQQMTRRCRTLKDEADVLARLEDAGIPRERVTGVDPDKVEDALEVTELTETDVYEIDTTDYVRKADVNDEVKQSRLQGLKDRLATSDDPEAEQLQREIENLEARIEELTAFKTGQQFHTRGAGE
jgi:hypothetical protein